VSRPKQGCLLNAVAHIAQQALGAHDWQPLSQSLGTKGERLFDWAILPCFHILTQDLGYVFGHSFVADKQAL